MDFKEVDCYAGDWIDLPQDRVQWRAYVRTVVNLQVPWKIVIQKYVMMITFLVPMGGSPGDVSEEPVTQEKRKKLWRMIFGVGEATGGLENEL